MTADGWSEYERLVMAELERLDASVRACQSELTEIRMGLVVLRTRAVSWGALGGMVMWLTTVVVGYMSK
jgi:hypothetical protein